jgi:UDP-3-O-[3-hydroxymyristoyl] N-acetylglucosamine deacetylase/3-hydroxyacyl-[acyl-carrier-protein] dehydratase
MRKPMVAAQTFAPPPAPTAAAEGGEVMIKDGETLDPLQVMNLLPHRFPFLMVDRVTKIQGNRITAVKNVTINEPYFQGHFPGHPIMPGVLQLEAIAQVAGILALKQAENTGRLAYFMSAEEVKWRKPVRPGDTLMIEVELTKARGKIGKAKGVCTVDGDVVSEAQITFILMDK